MGFLRDKWAAAPTDLGTGTVLTEADQFIQDVHDIVEELYLNDLLNDEIDLGRDAIKLFFRARGLGAKTKTGVSS